MDITDIASRLVSETSDGILISDREGVIRLWNGGCERIFGHSVEDALGKPLDIIIPENLRNRHRQGHDQTMRTGHTRYGAGDLLSVPALRKDGTRISVEFSITPFRDDEGRIVALAAIMRDVTKRFEEFKALRKAAAGAQEPTEVGSR